VIFGESRQHWYPAGTAIAVAPAANTNGLYVLAPVELFHLMMK
jgi:hypothetical protein